MMRKRKKRRKGRRRRRGRRWENFSGGGIPFNYQPPPLSQALMMDDDLLLDFWLEPIAVGKEVAFRVNSADLESVNGKLKAAGIQVTEAIENVQDAVNFQVTTTNALWDKTRSF